MFPESDTAKKFTGGSKRLHYIAFWGIAPHFRVFLDESLNLNYKRSIVFHLCIWSSDKVETGSRGLQFLASADVMSERLHSCRENFSF